jgi:hypothetical protein
MPGMDEKLPDYRPPITPPKPFQFGLKWLFWLPFAVGVFILLPWVLRFAFTSVAVLCGLGFAWLFAMAWLAKTLHGGDDE